MSKVRISNNFGKVGDCAYNSTHRICRISHFKAPRSVSGAKDGTYIVLKNKSPQIASGKAKVLTKHPSRARLEMSSDRSSP